MSKTNSGKTEIKLARFEGETGNRTADIICDGTVIGWIDVNYSGHYVSASSRQQIERVSGYTVNVTDETVRANATRDNVEIDRDFETRGEVTTWLRATIPALR